MHVQLSLKDLLLAGIPCSSSSFFSTSRTTSSRGKGSSERDILDASNSIDQNVKRSHSAEESMDISVNRRKRKGKAPLVISEVKKLKVESRLPTVFSDPSLLVGRLLLWNGTTNAHAVADSNSLDCLAFCDGAIAVCCTVQSLDIELLGQHVQVNSWTFVPATQHSGEQCHGEDGSADSNAIPLLERTVCNDISKLQEISGDETLVPQFSDCGGCLEIHSLKLLNQPSVFTAQVPDFSSLCLSPAAANARNLVLESPLERIGINKPRLRIRGYLQCISPPFILPSNSSLQYAPVVGDGRPLLRQGLQKSHLKGKSSSRFQSDSQSMLGFLVELRSCSHGTGCQLEYNRNDHSTIPGSQFPEEDVVNAGKDGNVIIYFSGAVASWRPVLGGIIGDCIAISGLLRRMIRVGPEKKEFCIYVATRTSLVFRIGPLMIDSNREKRGAVGFCKHIISDGLQNQPRDQFRHLRRLEGSHEVARSTSLRFQVQSRILLDSEASEKAGQGLRSYVGKITSIQMQDQLLELDDKVWLLLTHYRHTQVHGLRVGALVAIRHAHIMTLKNVSEKVLVLGACIRTHVRVILHSSSNARSRISQPSQSRLTKYIRALPFAFAFWVVQVIISLGCKLQGVYSDEELLGSMKHAGLIRKVLPSMMDTHVAIHRDAFKEFLLHEQFCLLGDTSASILLSKVPPLSNFCKHVEMSWLDPTSSIWHGEHTRNDGNSEPVVPPPSCYVRHIISSEKLGVVLIGSLKVCQSSGKLQLVDATGALDVVVPDLWSLSNLHCIYQIAKYKLVMEGKNTDPDVSAARKCKTAPSPLSWNSLLKRLVLENKMPPSLSFYVKFHLRYAKALGGLTWPFGLESQETQAAKDLLSTSDVLNDAASAWKGKEFNIALVTHKYPARLKYSSDKEQQWAFDVEVVLLPYNLLIHRDNDACSSSLNSALQSFNFNSSRVQGAIKFPDHVGSLQSHSLGELGVIKTHAHGSLLAHSGCLMECSVCCLVKQRSGLKEPAVHPCSTFSASLVARGCSARTSISGSYCATKEEHWARLAEVKLQKVLIAVNWRCIEMSQVLNTGDWCLLPSLQDKLLPISASESSLAFKRVEIDAYQPLISLQWRYAINCQLLQVDTKNLQQTVSSSRAIPISHNPSRSNIMELAECATKSGKMTLNISKRRCSDCDTEQMSESTMSSQPQLVDTVLTLPGASGNEFGRWLASLKRNLIPKTLSVSEALQLPSHSSTTSSKSGNNLGELCDVFNAVKMEASSGTFSLQGEVVSILGKIETMKCYNNPISIGGGFTEDPARSRFSVCAQRQTTLFQLRDLHTDELVRIQMNFNKYVRPVGFGPGAVACFQRILLRRDANLLVGMPTTNVRIESVEKRHYDFSHKSQLLEKFPKEETPRLKEEAPHLEEEVCEENATAVDLLNDFISESELRKTCLKVHCRVVSVQELELEWKITKPVGEFSANMLSVVRDVAVKWACFIIDDGSAVAECWTNGDQAAKLLGLHELSRDESTLCPSIVSLAQKSSLLREHQSALGASLPQVLKYLVQRHKRIYVQGEPPQGDTGTTSWLIKGVDGDLEESEGMIMRLILEQACQLGSKVVHCTSMSEKDPLSKYAREYHRRQTLSSASTMGNSRPWQNLTWNRTKLVATKVEVLNTWVELQQLASNFDI